MNEERDELENTENYDNNTSNKSSLTSASLGLLIKKLPLKVKIIIAGVVIGLSLFLLLILCGAAYVSMGQFGNKTADNWLGSFSNFSGSGISVNGVTMSRDEFINAVKNYRSDSGYQKRFAQYAGVMYDICKSKNINPVLIVAQAQAESGFGASVPSNSPWNYWGIGVYNGMSTGTYFSNIEEAITAYCDILLGYQNDSNSMSSIRSKQFAEVDDHFTTNMSSIYDIYSAYAYLGDYHSGHMWYNKGVSVTAKSFLNQYIPELNCTHALSEKTTLEEQAAYIVWYVDKKLIDGAKDIFGDKALVTNNKNSNPEIFQADGGYMDSVVTNNKRVSCVFWDDKYHTTHNHRGMDIAAPQGTKIIALGGGTVVDAKWNNARGYYVRIDHGNGYCTLYQHCLQLNVTVGEKVSKGQVIALVGNTGKSSGAHLHLELWVPHGQGKDNWGNKQWDVDDPAKFNYSLLPD